MKAKLTKKNTNDSRVYKAAIRYELYCPICAPNRGCNNRNHTTKSWKKYRKTQWKEKK